MTDRELNRWWRGLTVNQKRAVFIITQMTILTNLLSDPTKLARLIARHIK